MSHYNTNLNDISMLNKNLKIAFVSAEFNSKYVSAQEEIVTQVLSDNGFHNIATYRVPGALEVPAMVLRVLQKDHYDLVYCFGVVIRWETTHYDIVSNQSAKAIMNLSLQFPQTAIVNGISTCENEDQVIARINEHIGITGLNLLTAIKNI